MGPAGEGATDAMRPTKASSGWARLRMQVDAGFLMGALAKKRLHERETTWQPVSRGSAASMTASADGLVVGMLLTKHDMPRETCP
jgi:hypothetical protein